MKSILEARRVLEKFKKTDATSEAIFGNLQAKKKSGKLQQKSGWASNLSKGATKVHSNY